MDRNAAFPAPGAVLALVGSRHAGVLRIFRYELRCWRNGTIPDITDAVESPQRLSDDELEAHRLLAQLPAVPMKTWGRDELHAGEMWTSNSVVAWLLVRSGLGADAAHLPNHGRAPGWDAGAVVAMRSDHSGRAEPYPQGT